MLHWGKQFNIWAFCESSDKISTLHQQQKWAHNFSWKIIFTIFEYICEEFAAIFMHEFVKIQDISITGLAKMSHWEDFKISQWFQNLISSILECWYGLHIASYQSPCDGNPENNSLLLTVTSLLSGAQTGGNTPHLLYATRSHTAPNVDVSWDFPF